MLLILAKVIIIRQSVKIRRIGLFGDVAAYYVKSVIGNFVKILFEYIKLNIIKFSWTYPW
jgi:hypothetical protein